MCEWKRPGIRAIAAALLIGLISLFTQGLYAQFRVEAQFRNRFEFRDGYKKLSEKGSEPAAFISQRTRISFGFESERLKLRFTPQDVRVWGDEKASSATGVYGDSASLDLFEAFVQIKIGDNGWLSVGRQPLVYDGQRLLAARNWNQNGLSYDAVVYKWKSQAWEFHAGNSWNSTGENASDNFYNPSRIKSLNFLWAKHQVTSQWSLSLSHIASGVTPSANSNKLWFRQTSGVYTTYVGERVQTTGNLYYQFGKNTSRNRVNAWLFDADIAYKAESMTPGIGVSYLSGNHTLNGNTDRLFDVLYGARHRVFGDMDYFSNFGPHTKQGGLAELYVYLDFRLGNNTRLKNTGHYFRLAQNNESTPNKKNLGYENDLVLKHNFQDWGSLECGYAFFLPTRSLKSIQNVPETKHSQFFYLQLTLSPVLFRSNESR